MNKETKIVFCEVEKDDEKLVRENYPNAQIFAEPFSAKLAEDHPDAEIVCGMVHSDFSGETLERLPNLKLIVTRSVGYDHVDLKWAAEKKIPVCNVPDYGSHVIAEHVFALLLASIRNVLEGEARTNRDNFSCEGLRGMALRGKTIAVLGTGRIGAHVCRIASQGFLMNVLGFDKFQNEELKKLDNFSYADSLEEVWQEADIISLHLPLFPETHHIINQASIARMKDGATLINTARGGLIDTAALVAAVKSQKLGHVALDVVEHENNLKEDAELLHLPGVIITPHIAFYTRESVEKMYSEGFKSITEFLTGEVLSLQVHGH